MTGQTTDSSVFALISAFTSGLDVFKKLKKKRKRKGDPVDTEEARLSLSLKRGPTDIQQEYSKNYSIQGERYREGDCMAIFSFNILSLTVNSQSTCFSSSRSPQIEQWVGINHINFP